MNFVGGWSGEISRPSGYGMSGRIGAPGEACHCMDRLDRVIVCSSLTASIAFSTLNWIDLISAERRQPSPEPVAKDNDIGDIGHAVRAAPQDDDWLDRNVQTMRF